MKKPDSAPELPKETRQISSQELLQGGNCVLIEHSGVIYRLVKTRNDKLILQK